MSATKFHRALSREESQNNENEEFELDNKNKDGHTEPKLVSQLSNTQDNSNIYKETVIVMDDVERTKRQIRAENRRTMVKKRKRKGLCFWVNTFIKICVVMAVGYLIYAEVDRKTTDRPVCVEKPELTSSNPKPKVSPQRQTSSLIDRPFPEEYKIDMIELYEEKILKWIPEEGNEQRLTMPSTENACIKFNIAGKFKIFNSITLSYSQKSSIFHTVALKRAPKGGAKISRIPKMVVKKANYQWDTPQTGRQPSTLQFLLDLEVNDELCVQTEDFGMVYAGTTDNNFLVEKL